MYVPEESSCSVESDEEQRAPTCIVRNPQLSVESGEEHNTCTYDSTNAQALI